MPLKIFRAPAKIWVGENWASLTDANILNSHPVLFKYSKSRNNLQKKDILTARREL